MSTEYDTGTASAGRGQDMDDIDVATYDYALHGGERPERVLHAGRGQHVECYLRTGPNGERLTAEGLPHKTGIWTEAEDELLYLWQQRVGNKWSEVAKHIPGKSGQQCAQRWRHRVNPNIKREKWSKLEDALLVRLVELHGNQWATIARNVPGRTDQQCMGRWRRHLDPMIRRERWKQDEDLLLCALRIKYGNMWSKISKGLGGRTPQQCRTRHQHIETNMKTWLAQNMERINGLNVDEYERSLGFDDFDGARNAKHIVEKEGVMMRDRAALMVSKMRELPDAATIGGELVEELKATGTLSSPWHGSLQEPSDGGGDDGSVPVHLGEHSKGKGSGSRKLGGGASSTSASKGSSPSAADAFRKGLREEVDIFDNELPSFKPMDLSNVLHNTRYFLDRLKPTPLSVESFQPAAALLLSETAGPGARWELPYLPSQMALKPFQPFKGFSPFQKVTASLTREVGIAVNGASILGGQEKPMPISKPAPYLQKRTELPLHIRGTAQPTGLDSTAHPGSSDHADASEWTAKRARHTIELWPNPDVEEERRMREEGGLLQVARAQKMMRVLCSEGAAELNT